MTKTQQRETKQKDMPAKCAMFWDSERGYYDKTKQKETAVSLTSAPKAQKPETLYVPFDAEFRNYDECWAIKPIFRLRRDKQGYYLTQRTYTDIRAAQPPICDYETCPLQELTKEARAEGMAQGTLKTLDELEKWRQEHMNTSNWLTTLYMWIAAKRKEAQKEGKE